MILKHHNHDIKITANVTIYSLKDKGGLWTQYIETNSVKGWEKNCMYLESPLLIDRFWIVLNAFRLCVLN